MPTRDELSYEMKTGGDQALWLARACTESHTLIWGARVLLRAFQISSALKSSPKAPNWLVPRDVEEQGGAHEEASDANKGVDLSDGDPNAAFIVNRYRPSGDVPGLMHGTPLSDHRHMFTSSLAKGLSTLKWRDILRIPGINTYSMQTIQRLKAGKLSYWNRRDDNLDCPHSECTNMDATEPQHVFWDCVIPQRLWNSFLSRYHSVGFKASADLSRWIFELELPDTPGALWQELGTKLNVTGDQLEECQDLLYVTSQLLLSHTAAFTITSIWASRHRQQEPEETTMAAGVTIANAGMHASLLNLRQVLRRTTTQT